MKLCFVVLYAYVATTLLLQCDARNARHFKASSHTRRGFTVVEDSAYKIPRKIRPLKRLGVDPVVEQSAAADSPFSLPPLDDSYGYEAPLVMPKNGPPFCVNPPSVPTLTPPPTSPPTPFLFPGPPPPPSEFSSPFPPIYFPSPPGLPNPPEYVPSPPGETVGPPGNTPSPPVEYVPTPPSVGASPPEGYAPTPPSGGSVGASPPEGYAPTPPSGGSVGGSPPEGYAPTPPEGYVPGPPESYVPGPPEGYFPGPPPEGYVPGPPEGYEPTPPEFVPGPPYFLPPVVFPPPAKPPPYSGPGITLWCVAKPTVPDPIIQEAMNYACGSGADCHSIQPEGTCYQPDTLLSHASFAFNSYWQRTKANGGSCDFGGTAMLITQDPSFDGCRFIYY